MIQEREKGIGPVSELSSPEEGVGATEHPLGASGFQDGMMGLLTAELSANGRAALSRNEGYLDTLRSLSPLRDVRVKAGADSILQAGAWKLAAPLF